LVIYNDHEHGRMHTNARNTYTHARIHTHIYHLQKIENRKQWYVHVLALYSDVSYDTGNKCNCMCCSSEDLRWYTCTHTTNITNIFAKQFLSLKLVAESLQSSQRENRLGCDINWDFTISISDCNTNYWAVTSIYELATSTYEQVMWSD
jgi:hypothetical protein